MPTVHTRCFTRGRRLRNAAGGDGGSWKSSHFMVWKSCGVDCLSLWTRVCTQVYMRHKNSCPTSFFQDISLSDLFSRKLVPNDVHVMGALPGLLTTVAVLLFIFFFDDFDIGVVVCKSIFSTCLLFCRHSIYNRLAQNVKSCSEFAFTIISTTIFQFLYQQITTVSPRVSGSWRTWGTKTAGTHHSLKTLASLTYYLENWYPTIYA